MQVQKINEQHLETRFRWLNHPKIFSHMNMKFPISLIEVKDWYSRIYKNNDRIDLVFLDQDQVVAMTGLTSVNTIDGLAEFYIMVSPEYQSKGFGQKATTYTINYAFLNFNIHKIYLYTNNFNERANRLYGKLGFSLEGVLKKHKFKNGQHIDRCIYGLLKENWIASGNDLKDLVLEF
ncbi:GNAT family N-acetyltransferase [Acinetobacter indicus]|uniref:GNAT family N-acetyltransferase n=1 Tax=Acinetobacter indicus TaxID=756892 RepID=UPI00131512E5|nr:GNAT family protein [Acinetobacter indicus]